MNDVIRLTENKEIAYSSFVLRKNGLEPVGSPTFENWLECGEFIRQAKGAVHFWIGDWLNFGEVQWGQKYLEALKKTGYAYQTLADDKWVAMRVDFSRRRENLSFDHHKTVADLEPEEQDRLLREAEEKKLDSKSFRNYVQKQISPYGQIAVKKQQQGVVEAILSLNNQLLAKLRNLQIRSLTSEEKLLLSEELQRTADAIRMFFGGSQGV